MTCALFPAAVYLLVPIAKMLSFTVYFELGHLVVDLFAQALGPPSSGI